MMQQTTPPADGPRSIYLADLERCLPASALSWEPAPGVWRTLPYKSDQFEGTLLFAGETTRAPEIRYPLDVQGWHRISIGMLQERYDGNAVVQVRLSGDPAFTVLTAPEGPVYFLDEVYWKTADLTGQELIFRQLYGSEADAGTPSAYPAAQAKVAFIKLDPLTDEEVADLQAERADRTHKRLYAHNDAHGFHWMFGVTTPAEVLREIEPYRDTDFSRLYWEAGGGDLIYYPGERGKLLTCDGVRDFRTLGARLHAEAWRKMRRQGVDPFALAVEHAHAIGLEFHAGYRTAGFAFPPPEDQWNGGGFYDAHPELRTVDRNGRPSARISYAFPAARQYVLSVLREIVERYPVDGIALIYIRRPPLLDYEAPLVDSFIAEHGVDPRQLNERDERWLRHRAGFLTQFMREVRAEMAALAAGLGRKPVAITAMVSGREDENFFYGMDIQGWIKEGLVDTLIPYTMAPALDSTAEAWPVAGDAARWAEMARGTSTEVAFSVLPRHKSAEDYRRKAHQLYGEGAERLFFWDCSGRVNYTDQHAWNGLRRLGHREEIAAWVAAGEPPVETGRRPLIELAGWNMTYDTPG